MTWHKNSEGRHGENGRKGDKGEELVKQFFLSSGLKENDPINGFKHHLDYDSQVNKKIDFTLRGETLDVKSNVKKNFHTVEVVKFNKRTKKQTIGWIAATTAKYIYPVDLETGKIYCYEVNKMRKYVKDNESKIFVYEKNMLIKVPVTEDFIQEVN